MTIYDAHTHIGTNSTADQTPVELQIGELKIIGIHKAVAAPKESVLAATADELIRGNRDILELYEKYPEFIYPGASVNPLFPAESLEALQEFHRRGLVWAGEWVHYNCEIDYDQPQWEKLFDFCAEHNMIVQLHNHVSVAKIARRYPQLDIVAAHLYPEVLQLLTDLPNVIVDICGCNGGLCRNFLTDAKAMFGYQRLMFSSDFPIYDAEPYICRVKRAFPLEEQQKAVFSGNLKRLFKKHGVDF